MAEYWSVPTSSGEAAADLKGPAGGGGRVDAEFAPVLLSPSVKHQIQKIISQSAADKVNFSENEFRDFLEKEQKAANQGPIEGPVNSDKLAEYLLSPANDPVLISEVDLTHPLKDYLISSSHNTYLLGNQLYGGASIEGYKSVLLKGCRCIEIDCWDGHDNEPRVLHGHTAVEAIPFKTVCSAIAQYAFVTSDLPVIISLEVHCSLEQQQKMVDIGRQVFGDLLLKNRLDGLELDQLPSPLLLKNKILFKSKYLPRESQTTSESVVESDDDSDDSPKDAPKKPTVKVLRALSNLGIYATTTHFHSFSHPLSKLFNHVHSFSERVFKKLADEDPKALQEHNSKYLTRVYPFGLRFTSTNEEPAVFWRHGAQMVALNWQKFDLGMMENEALFRGTKGMILKPAVIEATVKPVVDITIEVIAAAGLPCPQHLKDIDKVQPFVKVEIRNGDKLKKETRVVKHSGACVVWEEVLKFGKIVDNLAFVRFLLYHHEIARDHLFGVFTVRLESLLTGYRCLRLLDVQGNLIPGAVLLVRICKI